MFNLNHLPNPVPEEKILFSVRRHWLTLTWLLLIALLLIFLPIGTLMYLTGNMPSVLSNPTLTPLLVIIGSVFFLFGWLFLFQNYIDYALDLWIVTTKRILNIEQNGLFSRTVSELRLYRIQDVTASVNGFVRTVFDYGLIEIQTAGEHERFTFRDVPHPDAVTKTVLEYAELDRREHLDEAVEEFAVADHHIKPEAAPTK